MTDNVETDETRIPLTSPDVLSERIEKLKDLFPEAFSEGKLDVDRLRLAVGDSAGEGRERYGLSWAGKADAIRAIQTPSAGTLVPCPEESVNFDTTENLFIEGDNLEVLKLLQKSYFGKVKMIYIDPPYNSNGDFIYPDNFREGLDGYLKYSGQADESGIKQSTNTETSGRYHSKWLNMMYPRLFLARNLLRDDGVIFVSIDFRESYNLRLIMNEIFGEENLVFDVSVVNNMKGRNDREGIATCHEHLLIYAKPLFRSRGLRLTSEKIAEYRERDETGEAFQWRDLRKRGGADTRELRPNMYFPLFADPNTGAITMSRTSQEHIEILPKKSDETDGCWRWGKKKVVQNLKLIRAKKVKGKDKWNVSYRVYLKQKGSVRTSKPKSAWIGAQYSTDSATKTLRAIMPEVDANKLTPKPMGMLKEIIEQSTGDSDLILDFFAGTGTTGQAVYESNLDDGASRQVLMVQLPEPTPEGSKARKAGFATISEIGMERLRRVARRMSAQRDGDLNFDEPVRHDHGIRSFKLTSSNFKVWDSETPVGETEKLVNQLTLFADHVLPDRSEQDILYELMLKAGLPYALTANIEEKDVAGKTAYSAAGGMLMICLADEITQDVLRGMIELAPQRIVCLDAAFKGNDQLKTNTVLEMKSHKIEFRTV